LFSCLFILQLLPLSVFSLSFLLQCPDPHSYVCERFILYKVGWACFEADVFDNIKFCYMSLLLSSKTVIIPFTFEDTIEENKFAIILYNSETWFLTLKIEHKLQVSENKLFRKVFLTKRNEESGGI
jgi:hypothetical protein